VELQVENNELKEKNEQLTLQLACLYLTQRVTLNNSSDYWANGLLTLTLTLTLVRLFISPLV